MSATFSTKMVHRSVKIPPKLDNLIREKKISFNRLVNELLEAYFNGSTSTTNISACEMSLAELQETVQEWTQRGEQIAQEIEHLKEQLSTLKERKEEANNLEQQVAKDCSYFGGFDDSGKVLCKAGLPIIGVPYHKPPKRCSRACPDYQKGGAL